MRCPVQKRSTLNGSFSAYVGDRKVGQLARGQGKIEDSPGIRCIGISGYMTLCMRSIVWLYLHRNVCKVGVERTADVPLRSIIIFQSFSVKTKRTIV